MRILACDTSNSTCCAGVYEDGREIKYELSLERLTHSETFMPLVSRVMKNSGFSHSDLDAYAITVGPGSFTGIRIGMSAVKGMALASGKKCIGVSATEALARSVDNVSAPVDRTIIVPCFDARNKRVFASVRRNSTYEILIAEGAYEAMELARKIKEFQDVVIAEAAPSSSSVTILVIGNGAPVMKEALAEAGVVPNGTFAPGIKAEYAEGAVILPKGVAEAAFNNPVIVSGAEIKAEYFAVSSAERYKNGR